MKNDRIYFDHNATQPLCHEAREEMLRALDHFGNPSSIHREGRAARKLVEEARSKIAFLVNAKPSEIIFTSGATEANQMAFVSQSWSAILFGSSEHLSVLSPARMISIPKFEIPSDHRGILQLDLALSWIDAHKQKDDPLLASIALANGETGVLQPLENFLQGIDPKRIIVHSDAVQAAGRVKIDFASLGLGMMSLSSHKMGGPKGIGALVVREGVKFNPLTTGGGQERRRRGGTENVIGIAGFGAAAEAALRTLEAMEVVRLLRHKLEVALRRITPDCIIFGDQVDRLPNTILVGVPGKLSETLVIKLDLLGVAVSAGSACSSGKVETSHVLKSMGVEVDIAQSAIRISLGRSTTEAEVQKFLTLWSEVAVQSALAA